MKELFIDVCGFSVVIQSQSHLPNFTNFLTKFPSSKLPAEIKVIIEKDSLYRLSIKKNSKEIFFYYIEDSQENTLNKMLLEICLLQAICRFIALLKMDHGIVLLHGTTVITPSGLGVILLDDGSGSGKTSLGVAVAKLGGAFVVDEFSFFNIANGAIIGGSGWPIHVRRDLIKHLSISTSYNDNILSLPEELELNSASQVIPKVIIFPKKSDNFSIKKILNLDDCLDKFEIAATDHLQKFLNPKLDRVSLFKRPPLIDFCLDFCLKKTVDDFIFSIKSISLILEVTVGNPRNIQSFSQSLSQYIESDSTYANINS